MNGYWTVCRYCGSFIHIIGKGKSPLDENGKNHGCTPRQRRFKAQFRGFANIRK